MAASAAPAVDPSSVAADQLKSIIERCERQAEEIAAAKEGLKDILAEAKANGFDVKVIREILKLRGMDHDEVQEQEAILELYKQALGMA